MSDPEKIRRCVDGNTIDIDKVRLDIISIKNELDTTLADINNRVKTVMDKYEDFKPYTKTGKKLFEISRLNLTPATKEMLVLETMKQVKIKLWLTFGISGIITLMFAIAQLFLN